METITLSLENDFNTIIAEPLSYHATVIINGVLDCVYYSHENTIKIKKNGNIFDIYIDENTSDESIDHIIKFEDKVNPEVFQYLNISQKGTEYSLTLDKNRIDNLSSGVNSEVFDITVYTKGASGKCYVKEIHKYITYDDIVMMTEYDDNIITKLYKIKDNEYKLTIKNLGKLDNTDCYYEIKVVHADMPSVSSILTLSYKELEIKDANISPSELFFNANGTCKNNNGVIRVNGTHVSALKQVMNNAEWLHIEYGYNCIKIHVTLNNGNRRETIINMDGKTVKIVQDEFPSIDRKDESSYEIADKSLLGNIDKTHAAIEEVSLDEKSINIRTWIYEIEEWTNNSDILIINDSKWITPIKKILGGIHQVTFNILPNFYGTDRYSYLYIKNANNLTTSLSYIIKQKANDIHGENYVIERLTIN